MKFLKQTLSFILVLLMLFSVIQCVMPVFAETILDDIDEPLITEDVTVVCEDVSRRTENSRTYIMSDGSFKTDYFTAADTIDSKDNPSGPRRARANQLPQLSVSGTYVDSSNVNSNYSEDENIYLGTNKIGFISTNGIIDSLSEYRITSAILTLPAASETSNAIVKAYTVNQNWDVDTVTYNTKPAYSTVSSDYSKVSDSVQFDISYALSNENCYGIALISNSDVVISKSAPSTAGVLSISYVYAGGVNEKFEYDSFDFDEFGTAYINKLTGNLSFIHNDIESDSFSISSVYDSMSTDKWKYNYNSHFSGYSAYVNENGATEILPVTEEKYGDYYLFTEDNEYGFEKIKATDFHVYNMDFWFIHLTFRIPIAFEVIADNGTKKINFLENRMDEIYEKDGENWNIIWKYNSVGENDFNIVSKDETITSSVENLSRTLSNGTESETINYDANGNVISFEKGNSVNVIFQYDNNNRITSISKGDYRITLSYNENSLSVNQVTEFFGTYQKSKIEYIRNGNSVIEHTEGADGIYNNTDDLYTTYNFDNACRLISTNATTESNEDLNSVAYTYENDNLTFVSSGGKITENYLKNHNIESLTDWVEGKTTSKTVTGTTSLDLNNYYVGTKSLKVTVSDFTSTNGFGRYQDFIVGENELIKPGETYVASAYVNVPNKLNKDADSASDRNFGVNVMVQETITGNSSTTNVYSQTIQNTNGEWRRIFVPFTVPENCSKIRVHLQIRNATGTAYFDGASLEIGKVPEDYNMLENNGFNYIENTSSNTGNNWVRKNMDTTDNTNGNSFVISGNPESNKYFYQDIYLNNDEISSKYVLNCVAKADSAPQNVASFAIRARVFYADNSYSNTKLTTKFNVYNHGSQYVQMGFELPKSSANQEIVKLRIYFLYQYNIGNAEVEKISLIRTNDVYSLEYTEKEVSFDGKRTDIIYNGDETIASYKIDGILHTCTYNNGKIIRDTVSSDTFKEYSYDDNSILSEMKTKIDGETVEDILYDYQGNITTYLQNDVTITYTYDENGNVKSEATGDTVTEYTYNSEQECTREQTTVNNEIVSYINYDSNGNITDSLEDDILTTYVYDANENLIRIESTKNNAVVCVTNYDENGNVVSETKDGTTINYTYDNNRNMTGIVKGNKTIGYSYTDDDIASVNVNGTVYNYTYDVWGNKQFISVGSQSIESYTCRSNGRNYATAYGNGSRETYTYNPYGKISKISKIGLGSYSFNYDSNGKLIYQTDSINNFKTYYDYNAAGQLIGNHVNSTLQSNTYANDIYDTSNKYDENGKIIKSNISSVYNSVENNYSYTTSEDETEQSTSRFTSSRSVNSVYDDNGAITSRTITTTTPFVQEYTYNENGNIVTESRGGQNFSYTYDDDGRLTEIKLNNQLRQSYVYDSEGQLIRENNIDTNKTTVYNYDGYGNIDSKVEYAFTTGDLSNSINTVNYVYGDNNWKDLLTSFNGESISYDSIGNPTTYRGATCTYFGRQLQSYTKNNIPITYKYDSDGLRTSKTVNGIQHDYYYVDGVLMYEKAGNDYELFYRYDADGKLAMISYYRFAENESGQFNVVTNTQGDVVKILGGSGYVRAEYSYDAFGNVTIVTDNPYNGFSIASVNSIRYRGYVYDSETGLYYLQSRYYDPETGRFINCDDPEYIGASDTFVGWNGFAYCENDPVNYIDIIGFSKSKKVSADKLDRTVADLMILVAFIAKKFGVNHENANIYYFKVDSCGLYYTKVKIDKNVYRFIFGNKKAWKESSKFMNSENEKWYLNYTSLFYETTSKAIEDKEALNSSFYITSDATLIFTTMKDLIKSNKYKKIYTAVWNGKISGDCYAFYVTGNKKYAGTYKYNISNNKISKVTI